MSLIDYDKFLITQIGARLDLRDPNKDALDVLVRHLAESEGYEELIAEMATGVGKTYLMAGLIEYLAEHGVQNVLIVTPGKTIQRKTLENFTPGSPKYIRGSEHAPFVITPENFNSAAAGSAMRDPNRLKLYVFNIHQFIAPTQKTAKDAAARRARRDDEMLGGQLYELLQQMDDLIILADEHHTYREKAESFSRAIRELQARALVGLTATPDPSDAEKIVFRYTLGQAIRDGYVKTPVIVYRPDGKTGDDETRLMDACQLLGRKEEAYREYQKEHGARVVNPVLFVVCPDIKYADDVATMLAGDQYLGDPDKVLLIHSGSSDENLARLEAVEDPESPVRAIVSVNMLKEGWDVKNIAVIVALRSLVSQSLTAQIIGRGLRLPYGAKTKVPHVDQIDLVAHEKYRQLMAQEELLRQQIDSSSVTQRTTASGVVEESSIPQDVRKAVEAAEQEAGEPASAEPVVITSEGPRESAAGDPTLAFGGSPGEGLLISGIELRMEQQSVYSYTRRDGAPQILFPRQTTRVEDYSFDLADVSEKDIETAGAQCTDELTSKLLRDKLSVTDHNARWQRAEDVEASQRVVPVSEVEKNLVASILNFDVIEKHQAHQRGARRLARKFIEAAGDDGQWGVRRMDRAVELVHEVILSEIRRHPAKRVYELHLVTLPEEPEVYSEEPLDQRVHEYVARKPFVGWERSIMPTQKFDSKSAEWALARLLDRDDAIAWWQRIRTFSDSSIATPAGRYYPDFVAIDTSGIHWVIEAKSDSNANDTDVIEKREEAQRWVRKAEDHDFGQWQHLFATESSIADAGFSWENLLRLGITDR